MDTLTLVFLVILSPRITMKRKSKSNFPASNYMFKVNNRNTRIGVKYVQSQQ